MHIDVTLCLVQTVARADDRDLRRAAGKSCRDWGRLASLRERFRKFLMKCTQVPAVHSRRSRIGGHPAGIASILSLRMCRPVLSGSLRYRSRIIERQPLLMERRVVCFSRAFFRFGTSTRGPALFLPVLNANILGIRSRNVHGGRSILNPLF